MYGLVPTLKNEIVGIAPKARVNSVNPGEYKRMDLYLQQADCAVRLGGHAHGQEHHAR